MDAVTEYHSRLDAPLAYHNFNRYFAVPAGAVLTIVRFALELNGLLILHWVYIVEFVYYIAAIGLLIAAFVGFLRWRLYGYRCFFINLGLSLSYDLYVMIAFAAYGLTTESTSVISQLVVLIVYAVPVSIYYRKRRPLFEPGDRMKLAAITGAQSQSAARLNPWDAPPPQPRREAEPVPTPAASQVLYCRKCGEKITGDSVFCAYCGEKIVRA